MRRPAVVALRIVDSRPAAGGGGERGGGGGPGERAELAEDVVERGGGGGGRDGSRRHLAATSRRPRASGRSSARPTFKMSVPGVFATHVVRGTPKRVAFAPRTKPPAAAAPPPRAARAPAAAPPQPQLVYAPIAMPMPVMYVMPVAPMYWPPQQQTAVPQPPPATAPAQPKAPAAWTKPRLTGTRLARAAQPDRAVGSCGARLLLAGPGGVQPRVRERQVRPAARRARRRPHLVQREVCSEPGDAGACLCRRSNRETAAPLQCRRRTATSHAVPPSRRTGLRAVRGQEARQPPDEAAPRGAAAQRGAAASPDRRAGACCAQIHGHGLPEDRRAARLPLKRSSTVRELDVILCAVSLALVSRVGRRRRRRLEPALRRGAHRRHAAAASSLTIRLTPSSCVDTILWRTRAPPLRASSCSSAAPRDATAVSSTSTTDPSPAGAASPDAAGRLAPPGAAQHGGGGGGRVERGSDRGGVRRLVSDHLMSERPRGVQTRRRQRASASAPPARPSHGEAFVSRAPRAGGRRRLARTPQNGPPPPLPGSSLAGDARRRRARAVPAAARTACGLRTLRSRHPLGQHARAAASSPSTGCTLT